MTSPSGDGSDSLAIEARRSIAPAVVILPPADDFAGAGESEAVMMTSGDGGDGLAVESSRNVALAKVVGPPGDDLAEGGGDGEQEEEDDRKGPR